MALAFQRRKIHREPASSRRARSTQVIVANSIENAAHLDEAEAVAAMVDQIVDAMRARTARLCGDADAHDDADGDDSDDDIG